MTLRLHMTQSVIKIDVCPQAIHGNQDVIALIPCRYPTVTTTMQTPKDQLVKRAQQQMLTALADSCRGDGSPHCHILQQLAKPG